MDDDVISIHDSDEAESFDREAILEPVIRRVVDALGGYEKGVYRLGDEVSGCLRDLKKLWRKDDTDDERTVARIFWNTRVLPNDLVPILLATAGTGLVEDKRAVACVDLMTAMTWPIDLAEELKELDDELDRGTDYTQLLQSHLHYKAALLRPGVMQALVAIMMPPLSKGIKERKERDGQIINVILHLIRNLAFIKDPSPNMRLSADQAEYSSSQSKLIKALSDTRILDLLLAIGANPENDPLLNSWNSLVLEILYLLFRGVKPSILALDQAKQTTHALHRLLAGEDKIRREQSRNVSSRHSRFGTTVSVRLNPNKKMKTTDDNNLQVVSSADQSPAFVLHRPQAIYGEPGTVLDIAKHQRARKGKIIDELAREDNLSMAAKNILQGFAKEFVNSCFNPFLSSLLKDIKSERVKITEKDNLRLLFVTKWFLDFFLVLRSKEQETVADSHKWTLGLVAEVTDRGWIGWVLRRMREAMEEKPKMWTELQAGIECLTQLLLLIDHMSSTVITDPDLNEAADILQQQLVYNGEVLDIAFDSLRSYRDGTQTLTYLNSSVYLAYVLLRMLEKWSKHNANEMTYVRQKRLDRKKQAKQKSATTEGIPDSDDGEGTDDEGEVIHETMFTFEAFEMKFAHSEITRSLLTYLSRYKDFESTEHMKRVVSLMHRQIVRAKAEGLYFNVSTLHLFKSILDERKSQPDEKPYKDLINMIQFVLRQFFKALSDDAFLAVEAFFPMNRGHWKQFSSWEPEKTTKRERPPAAEDTKFPPDIKVKKGFSWSEQVGIAVAALVESGQAELVEWIKDILKLVIRQREAISKEGSDSEDVNDEEAAEAADETKSESTPEDSPQITDFLIPYVSNEQVEAATKNPRMKLLFRLINFRVTDEDADELEWSVPASVPLTDLQGSLNVISQFLEHPLDLGGKKASGLLAKKSRRGRRRRQSITVESEEELSDEPLRTKRAKKEKEKKAYKSAQFIEDSDEEAGDLDTFLEKEKELRARTEQLAAETGRVATMKTNGTKKKRRLA